MDMMNNLGEIFYNGRIINLNVANESELKNRMQELEEAQKNIKAMIRQILKQMIKENEKW